MKAKWLDNLNAWLAPESSPAPTSLEPDLLQTVEAARQEWLFAQKYYNDVSDPELVDHAVYQMQAAEKKYTYLLRQARLQGITHSPYGMNDH